MDHTQVAFRTFACMVNVFDHVRSAEIVTPRHFVCCTHVMGDPSTEMLSLGGFLARVMFMRHDSDAFNFRPCELVQFWMEFTSCWKASESWSELTGLYNRISSA